MTDTPILAALIPVLLLLFFGVVAAVASRAVRLSPIVGYLLLGLLLKSFGVMVISDSGTVAILAELGVVFLLFDIGLHFSLAHVREQARDIFGFGPLQILFAAVPLGLIAWAAGMTPLAAGLMGTILALSSTAVVARLIAERHQQSCPVGLTATAILIFQDVAAIFLLIVAGALQGSGHGVMRAAGMALLKAGFAFGVAVVLARLLVRPLFTIVGAQRQRGGVYGYCPADRAGSRLGHRFHRPVADTGGLPRRHDHRRNALSGPGPVRDQPVPWAPAELLLHRGRAVTRFAGDFARLAAGDRRRPRA